MSNQTIGKQCISHAHGDERVKVSLTHHVLVHFCTDSFTWGLFHQTMFFGRPLVSRCFCCLILAEAARTPCPIVDGHVRHEAIADFVFLVQLKAFRIGT